MKKILWISIVMVVVVAMPLYAYAAPAPAKVYQWRLQAFYPPSEEKFVISLAEFPKFVDKATNGQIKITLFPAGALVPPPEIFKSVGEGIVELGLTVPGYHVGMMPFCAIPDGLPLSWGNPNQLREAMLERGLANLMREEYAKHGVYFLTWQGGGPMCVDARKELRTQDDFKGVKVRSWGGWNKYFRMLGFSPVDVPLKDVYMGLSMGTFDGAFTGLAAHYSMKHYEVAKFGMKPFIIGDAVHDININLKVWNALPDDLKKKLAKAAADFNDWNTKTFYPEYDLGYEKKLSAAGLKWVEVDGPAWTFMQDKAREYWADVAAKDTASAKAIDIMKGVLKR
jgi:TRAP-type C4-dicarboxylate transport system substrate-binding protein